jgi:hypothetical protein
MSPLVVFERRRESIRSRRGIGRPRWCGCPASRMELVDIRTALRQNPTECWIDGAWKGPAAFATLCSLRNNDWTKIFWDGRAIGYIEAKSTGTPRR